MSPWIDQLESANSAQRPFAGAEGIKENEDEEEDVAGDGSSRREHLSTCSFRLAFDDEDILPSSSDFNDEDVLQSSSDFDDEDVLRSSSDFDDEDVLMTSASDFDDEDVLRPSSDSEDEDITNLSPIDSSNEGSPQPSLSTNSGSASTSSRADHQHLYTFNLELLSISTLVEGQALNIHQHQDPLSHLFGTPHPNDIYTGPVLMTYDGAAITIYLHLFNRPTDYWVSWIIEHGTELFLHYDWY
ncbi:hypothetical protein RSAG8_07208, partial [Rhizoctonia solani AG-8 WAC10335]